MTDFFADLERELTGAAHRRAAGRALRRLRFQPLLAAAVAAAAVVAVLAVALGRGPADVERPVVADPPAPAPAPTYSPASCGRENGFPAPAGPPPRSVREALPILPEQYRAVVALPEPAARALGRLHVRAAYVDAVARVPAGQGTDVFVVPVRAVRPCRGARSVGTETFGGHGACLFAVRGPALVASVCDDLDGIRRGRVTPVTLTGATLVLGFQPLEAPTTGFETATGGSAVLRYQGGVVAKVIADTERADLAREIPAISESKAGAPAPPAPELPVTVLNGTTTTGLAQRVSERLAQGSGLRPARVDTAPSQAVRRTRVLFSDPGLAAPARDAAEATGLAGLRAERVSRDEMERLGARDGESVLILLGRDARMR